MNEVQIKNQLDFFILLKALLLNYEHKYRLPSRPLPIAHRLLFNEIDQIDEIDEIDQIDQTD